MGLLAIFLSVEVAVLLVAVGTFILHGAAGRWRARRNAAHAESMSDAILEVVLGNGPGAVDLHALGRVPAHTQLNILARVAGQLDGSAIVQLSELARRLGLVDGAERLCRSHLWWRRLEGARYLTWLDAGEDTVSRLLTDRHPLVAAQAAEWAARHPSPEIISVLLEALESPEDFVRASARYALSEMGMSASEALAQYITSHSGASVEPALVVSYRLADPRFLGPALLRCRDPEPGVRRAAVQILGALGGEEAATTLVKLLADGEMSVRAAAATSLSQIGYWPAAPALAACLRDRHWPVRSAAGLALQALGPAGALFLRRSVHDQDRFAADMATQVLSLPTYGQSA